MPTEAEMRAAFRQFDADGSGSLSAEELKNILTRPGGGSPMTLAQCTEIIKSFDANGDGVLQLDEVRCYQDPQIRAPYGDWLI